MYKLAFNENCKIIIAGDVNQLKYKDLLVHASLSQMVKKPTRGENVLDVFMTNTPYLWEKVKVFESTIRSDHNMVIACPRTSAKAKRSTIQFRDVREHRKFIWLICLKVMIGKRSFLLLIVNWNVTSYLILFGPCLTSVSRWFLFVHPPGILLSFHHWLNIFWNSGIGCKRDPNCFLLAFRTKINHLIRENQRQAVKQESCMSGRARVLDGPLSIPSLEEILRPSWLVQSFIRTPLMNTFVA